MFGRKKVNSEEYERIVKRLIDMESDIMKLKGENISLESQIRTIRGKLNRTIYKDNDDEGKDLNSSVLLPYNGSF